MTDERALVTVRREGGLRRDRLRNYKVRVDGVQVGIVGPDEELPLEVSPGIHEVQVKLDWGTSRRLMVQVEPGQVTWLRCGPGSLLGVIIPGMYITLELDDPSTELGEKTDEGDNIWSDVWEGDDPARS